MFAPPNASFNLSEIVPKCVPLHQQQELRAFLRSTPSRPAAGRSRTLPNPSKGGYLLTTARAGVARLSFLGRAPTTTHTLMQIPSFYVLFLRRNDALRLFLLLGVAEELTKSCQREGGRLFHHNSVPQTPIRTPTVHSLVGPTTLTQEIEISSEAIDQSSLKVFRNAY
jgi:hypothetical protein